METFEILFVLEIVLLKNQSKCLISFKIVSKMSLDLQSSKTQQFRNIWNSICSGVYIGQKLSKFLIIFFWSSIKDNNWKKWNSISSGDCTAKKPIKIPKIPENFIQNVFYPSSIKDASILETLGIPKLLMKGHLDKRKSFSPRQKFQGGKNRLQTLLKRM